MKAFFRKLGRARKRKFLKRAITVGLGAWALKYGRINQTTDLPINSSQEIQSINNQTTYRETESSFTELVSDQYSYQDSNESLTGQKSELTYSQEELDALGLGNVDRKVTLVVGLPMPHSSQHTLAVHEENLNRLVQESNISINIAQEPRIVLIRTKSDLRNPQWIKELISGIRGGDDTLDEELIRSIISKVSESDWDIPSINKILKKLAEVTLEIGSNDKLMRILTEFQKPIAESPLTVTSSNEVVKIPTNLQDYQDASRSSSSIFVEGFLPRLPHHRKRNEVEWKKENKLLSN